MTSIAGATVGATGRATPGADTRAYRLSGIDMLRGLAIVIMALDHVRDYMMVSGVPDPMADPNVSPALFATRWVTHICAPAFVLLAGTSAGLMTARRTPVDLGRFLLARGLWLIAIEWFVISTAWTFAPGGIEQLGGRVLVGLQVIWAIGASMVVLAAAQFLGRRACLAIGLAIIAGHNLLDGVWPMVVETEPGPPLWIALHARMTAVVGPFHVFLIYPLLPWVSVMLLGFGIAGVFELPAARRNALLQRAGLAMTAAFVVLRALDLYGDPNPWQVQADGTVATIIDLLNTTKYPPSLAFLLMTLGPAAIIGARADRLTGWVKDTLVTFGRVPFAFYVAHLFLIHAVSVALGVAQGFDASQFFTFFEFYPEGYGVPLPAVYVAWVLVVGMLYPLCRAVAAVKARRRDWWLSYV